MQETNRAKLVILDMLKTHYSPGANQKEAFVKVPNDKVGIVIGKGGESIKDIERRSGTCVEIDRLERSVHDGNEKVFVMRGDQEQIQYAQKLIDKKMNGVQFTQDDTLLE